MKKLILTAIVAVASLLLALFGVSDDSEGNINENPPSADADSLFSCYAPYRVYVDSGTSGVILHDHLKESINMVDEIMLGGNA